MSVKQPTTLLHGASSPQLDTGFMIATATAQLLK
jgi:hypothetical protein